MEDGFSQLSSTIAELSDDSFSECQKTMRKLFWITQLSRERALFYRQMVNRFQRMCGVQFCTKPGVLTDNAVLAKALFLAGSIGNRPAGKISIGPYTVILSEGFLIARKNDAKRHNLVNYLIWKCEHQSETDRDFILVFKTASVGLKCFIQQAKQLEPLELAALLVWTESLDLPERTLHIRSNNYYWLRLAMYAFGQEGLTDTRRFGMFAHSSDPELYKIQMHLLKSLLPLVKLQNRLLSLIFDSKLSSQDVRRDESFKSNALFLLNFNLSTFRIFSRAECADLDGIAVDTWDRLESWAIQMIEADIHATTKQDIEWKLRALYGFLKFLEWYITPTLATDECYLIANRRHITLSGTLLNRLYQRIVNATELFFQRESFKLGDDSQSRLFEERTFIGIRLSLAKERILKIFGPIMDDMQHYMIPFQPKFFSPSVGMSAAALEDLRKHGYEVFAPILRSPSFRGINTLTGKSICIHTIQREDPQECLPRNTLKLRSLRYMQLANLDDVLSYGPYRILITEFCELGTLTEYSQRINLFGQSLIVRRIMQDVIHGVAYLHSQNIAHGTIRPSVNLLVTLPDQSTDEPIVKVADYFHSGLRTLLLSGNDRYSWSKVEIESLFIAPEVRRGEAATRKSDIWSIGGVLLYLMLGEEGWRNWSRTVMTIEKDTFNSIVLEVMSIPSILSDDPSFGPIVTACLQMCPNKRPEAMDLFRMGILRNKP